MSETLAKISIAFLALTIALLFSGCVVPVNGDTAVDTSEDRGAPEPGPKWVVFNTKNSELPFGTVYDLAVGGDNLVWSGTTLGLANYSTDGWTVYTCDNSGLPANKTTALIFDDADNLWIGTDDGLACFDGKSWNIYTTENSRIPYDAVRELAIDREGVLWIGTGCDYCTGSGGLTRFDGETWRTYD